MSVIGCQLSGVGVDFRFYPSMVIVYCWLPGVGYRVLTVNCRVPLSAVVVGSWFGCRVTVVGSWLSGVGCLLFLVVCIGCRSVVPLLVPSSRYQ